MTHSYRSVGAGQAGADQSGTISPAPGEPDANTALLPLAGMRVFIVEDEALILFTLRDMLEELGCQVVASALRIDDALAKGGSLTFDVAILDVNVAGERVGLLVEQFHREVDVILKPMEGLLAYADEFSGTALLGDGLVLLVLNMKEVLSLGARVA